MILDDGECRIISVDIKKGVDGLFFLDHWYKAEMKKLLKEAMDEYFTDQQDMFGDVLEDMKSKLEERD